MSDNTNSTLTDIYNVSVSDTWQSIYVAVVLTSIQIGIFLICFEIARRHLPRVYDRRRYISPKRTPPPLRKRWYPTWWQITLSNPAYNEMSRKEAQEEEEQTKNTEMRLHEDLELVRQAERDVRMSVPFFRDVMDKDLNAAEEEGDTTAKQADVLLDEESPPNRDTKNKRDTQDEGLMPLDSQDDEEEVWDIDDVELALPTIPSKPATMSKRRSLSLPEIVASPRDDEFILSRQRTRSNRRASLSEHDQPKTHIPLVIGGATSNENHRVRFDDVYAKEGRTSIRSFSRSHTDVTLGTSESDRLAKLRYEKEDVPFNWDKHLAVKTAKFIKTQILMLRDDDEQEDDEHKKFLSRQVMRRPLSMEDQELLRCIGLDAFMVLRFLRFATDVFFWPMILALVTLVPLYITADNGAIGFFATTIVALIDPSGDDKRAKYWLVVGFEYIHFCYILRRLWIEWELFMPLRYDFLEHGDFDNEKYKGQYRMTCLVEYIPASHKNDKALFQFFDTLFPERVKRAEVLLNTEHLRTLIRDRLNHIVAYENVFAKMVHERANYLRDCRVYEEHGGHVRGCCRELMKPEEPTEPRTVVIRKVDRADMGNVFLQPQTKKVYDSRTLFAREWHHRYVHECSHVKFCV